MTKQEFIELFSEEVGANGFYLTKDTFVFRKPLSIWDSVTNEEAEFKNIDELFNYNYKGKSIAEYIESMDVLPTMVDGSTGSGENKTFKFNHAKGNGEDKTEDILPAYANVRIKAKTLEGAMEEFRERFASADIEWAYEVDPQGYVHQFKKGNPTSVSIGGTHKDNMILHNHPNGGAFSDSDLISTSLGNQKGIVASGKKVIIYSRKEHILKRPNLLKQLKMQR